MKKLMVAMTGVGMMVLAGCGVNQSTPEEAAESMFKALRSGDAKDVIKLVNSKGEDFSNKSRGTIEDEVKELTKKIEKKGVKFVTANVAEEKTVLVWYKDKDGKEASTPFHVYLKGDKWYVSLASVMGKASWLNDRDAD